MRISIANLFRIYPPFELEAGSLRCWGQFGGMLDIQINLKIKQYFQLKIEEDCLGPITDIFFRWVAQPPRETIQWFATKNLPGDWWENPWWRENPWWSPKSSGDHPWQQGLFWQIDAACFNKLFVSINKTRSRCLWLTSSNIELGCWWSPGSHESSSFVLMCWNMENVYLANLGPPSKFGTWHVHQITGFWGRTIAITLCLAPWSAKEAFGYPISFSRRSANVPKEVSYKAQWDEKKW